MAFLVGSRSSYCTNCKLGGGFGRLDETAIAAGAGLGHFCQRIQKIGSTCMLADCRRRFFRTCARSGYEAGGNSARLLRLQGHHQTISNLNKGGANSTASKCLEHQFELANSLKPIVLPGRGRCVSFHSQGRAKSTTRAWLTWDDGTMGGLSTNAKEGDLEDHRPSPWTSVLQTNRGGR